MTAIPLLLLPSFGTTEHKTKYGVSYLAMLSKDFPCDTALQVYKGLPEANLEILWGTFGKHFKCLKRWAALPQRKTLIIHFSNESCRRLGKCYEGEFLPHLSPREYDKLLQEPPKWLKRMIRKRARRIRDAMQAMVGLSASIHMTTGLESDFGLRAASTLGKLLHRVTPYAIVHNPLLHSRRLPFGLHEYHDHRVTCGRGGIFVNDGTDFAFSHRGRPYGNSLSVQDLLSTWERNERAGCEIQLAWFSGAQGRHTGRFSHPRQRSYRVSGEDVTELNQLLRRKYAK